MKRLLSDVNYETTIKVAQTINEDYAESVTFHCYWNGELNEKHLYSIASCYYFNVYNNKHKIILWIENNTTNQYNNEIQKYAEIKSFSLHDEKNRMFLKDSNFYYKKALSYYSDVVRYLLLYNYGGTWFDVDCFFLRNFDPLFYNYGNDICVYQWEHQNFPNGAIYICLEAKSERLKALIEFIVKSNEGWGFEETRIITYDTPIDLFVLPCSWFDAGWIQNPLKIQYNDFFVKTDTKNDFNSFFKGAFCFHWHNKWNDIIEENSIAHQLFQIIKQRI